jgi:hypothetical protein
MSWAILMLLCLIHGASFKLNLSSPTKISCVCKLYAMDRLRLVIDAVKPLTSDLPKHSIERDKQAVAYHYEQQFNSLN